MMRALLDHTITVEDLILIVSLLINAVAFMALLVAVDVRYANWRRRREWQKTRQAEGRAAAENIRNPRYGLKPKDDAT